MHLKNLKDVGALGDELARLTNRRPQIEKVGGNGKVEIMVTDSDGYRCVVMMPAGSPELLGVRALLETHVHRRINEIKAKLAEMGVEVD